MTSADIWLTIAILGPFTFLIRFSFIGLIGGRTLPDWLMRHLRYVPVAVMPGLVAPLVAWPAATGGETDPARLMAALTAIALGIGTRNAVWTILGGLSVLFGAGWLLG